MSINAKPLPEAGRPASFQGAVGHFTLSAETDRKEAQVNDAVGLTVKVQGDGNARSIGEPLLPDLPDYRRFDPKVEEKSEIKGDRIEGTRSWTYVLVPLAAGEKAIPPVKFSYFAPAAAAYKELSGPPMTIKVSHGTGGASSAEAAGVRRDVVAVRRDIRYLKPGSALAAASDAFRRSPW